jgi:hypothetical protein
MPTTRFAAVPRLRCPGQAVRHPNQILPSIALTAPYLSYGLAPVPEDVRFARTEHAGMKLRPVAHLSLFSNKTNADAPSSHRAQSRITFTSATSLCPNCARSASTRPIASSISLSATIAYRSKTERVFHPPIFIITPSATPLARALRAGSPTYFRLVRCQFTEHLAQRPAVSTFLLHCGHTICPRPAAQQTFVHTTRKSRTRLPSPRVET